MKSGSPEWKVHPPDTRADDIDKVLRVIEDDETLNAYRPSFLGEGGEQIVFDIPHHPEVVAKVHRYTLLSTLAGHNRDGVPLDEATENERREFEEIVENNKKVYYHMREYFGDAVLKERQIITHVPVTTEVLRTVFGDHLPEVSEGVHRVLTVLRIQERVPDAVQDAAIDIGFQYLEDSRITNEQYEHLHGVLFGKLSGAEYLQSFPAGVCLLEAMVKDPELQATIRKFVEQAVRFTVETGEMLDLAGSHNAIVYRSEDHWQVMLPDAMYPQRGRWSDAREALEDLAQGRDISGEQGNALMNGFNFAGLMNALADYTGSNVRLALTRGGHEVVIPNLLQLLRETTRGS